MDAWAAGFNVRLVLVHVVGERGPRMLMGREAVVVLGVIVTGVRVDVQCRLAGRGGQDRCDQKGDQPVHHASV
jgi:hypothetical protein